MQRADCLPTQGDGDGWDWLTVVLVRRGWCLVKTLSRGKEIEVKRKSVYDKSWKVPYQLSWYLN
jgi:hypothetical protein